MDRVFALNASSTPPTMPTTLETGYVQEGNIFTDLGAWWYHSVTQELYNAIVALGITPNKALVNQLATGLTNLLNSVNTLSSNLNTVSANSMPIGALLPWPGPTPPAGFIKANGILLPRSGNGSFPLLTNVVLSGLVSTIADVSWSSYPGRFSTGDGASTIRVPDGRGLVLKGHHDGSANFTTNTSRATGSYEGDQVLAHKHVVSTQAGTNGGWNIAQTDRGGYDYSQPRDTSTVGGLENLVRNISILWCLRAY